MEYCPKCFCIVDVLKHSYYGNDGKLERIEHLCMKCGQTISIHHYSNIKEVNKDEGNC